MPRRWPAVYIDAPWCTFSLAWTDIPGCTFQLLYYLIASPPPASAVPLESRPPGQLSGSLEPISRPPNGSVRWWSSGAGRKETATVLESRESLRPDPGVLTRGRGWGAIVKWNTCELFQCTEDWGCMLAAQEWVHSEVVAISVAAGSLTAPCSFQGLGLFILRDYPVRRQPELCGDFSGKYSAVKAGSPAELLQ